MRVEEGKIMIAALLSRDAVLEALTAQTKREALAEMVGVLGPRHGVGSEAMLHVILEREKLGSTGIGEGIAIPHGKLAGLETMMVAFGRSRRGIDFEAMDGRPVHLFFLLLAPEASAGVHLKALAKISRMLRDPVFRQQLLDAPQADDLYRAILQKDETT